MRADDVDELPAASRDAAFGKLDVRRGCQDGTAMPRPLGASADLARSNKSSDSRSWESCGTARPGIKPATLIAHAAASAFQAVGKKANPRPREMKLNPPARAETAAGDNTPNAKHTTAAT